MSTTRDVAAHGAPLGDVIMECGLLFGDWALKLGERFRSGQPAPAAKITGNSGDAHDAG